MDHLYHKRIAKKYAKYIYNSSSVEAWKTNGEVYVHLRSDLKFYNKNPERNKQVYSLVAH